MGPLRVQMRMHVPGIGPALRKEVRMEGDPPARFEVPGIIGRPAGPGKAPAGVRKRLSYGSLERIRRGLYAGGWTPAGLRA